MLEKLDDINFSILRHAYGPAVDIPELLRKRAIDDYEIVADVDRALFSSIVHQGTVYSVTSYCVPFLIELLESPDTLNRDSLVILLASIAEGYGYYEVHGVPSAEQAVAFGQELINQDIADELVYVPRARQAVADYLPLYVNLLNDSEETVRWWTPYLLSVIPQAHEWLRSNAISFASQTKDALLATNLIFALAPAVKDRAEFGTMIATARLPWHVMMDIAISHVVLMSGDSTRLVDASKIAILPLSNPKEYEAYFRHHFFDSGDEEALFLNLIMKVPKAAIAPLLRSVCEVLSLISINSAASIAGDMLFLAFDPKNLPTDYKELTPEQETILKQIDRSKQNLHNDEYQVVMAHLQKHSILANLGINSREPGRW